MNRLLIAVVGNRHSGKSYTWNHLFGRTVHTGTKEKELPLGNGESVSVFVVSGSPQERKRDIEEIMQGEPRIVLCSLQYKDEAFDSLDYFFNNGFFAVVHWLNPGHNDRDRQADQHHLIEYVLRQGWLVGIRDGNEDATDRVEEIRDFIRGWAVGRNLVYPSEPTHHQEAVPG